MRLKNIIQLFNLIDIIIQNNNKYYIRLIDEIIGIKKINLNEAYNYINKQENIDEALIYNIKTNNIREAS